MEPWKPHQANFIAACHDEGKQFVCAFCGLQAGKTIAGARAAYELLFSEKCLVLPEHLRGVQHGEFWILSKSYALVDVAVATFRSVVPEELFLSKREMMERGLMRGDARTWWMRATRERRVRGDGLEVCVRGRTTADPEAMRATPTLLLAWADECAHWREAAWKNLMGRAIAARSKFIVTTTPKGKNWAYRDLYVPGKSGRDGTISVHSWRSVDNPYADKAYIEKLWKQFGPEYAAQELEGAFVENVGYVYDFDREVHQGKGLPVRDWKHYPVRVVGVDPGYGDPYAAVLCLRDKDYHWWIADEMYLRSKATFAEAYPKLNTWYRTWKVQAYYVDKRRPTDYQSLKKMGLPARANVDVFGENERRTIMPMIRMVQRVIREGRFHVVPDLEWLPDEMENYAFPDRGEERNRGENPVDWRNHCLDALRYAICSVEALPEDQRARYRSGVTQLPLPVVARERLAREANPRGVTVGEVLKAEEDRWFKELMTKGARLGGTREERWAGRAERRLRLWGGKGYSGGRWGK